MKFLVSLLVVLLLSACASYDGRGLKPGASTEAQVIELMGQPAMRWQENDGSAVLAYPRGPSGTETFMVTIGRDGLMTAKENVLDLQHFARIQPGMSEQEVLRVLGPSQPGWTANYPARNETVWEWRYCNDFSQASRFDVIFDSASGQVKTTQSYVESVGRGHPHC
ncbi:MAG: hypothetical protein FIB06_12290 [Betaproteobacteria bacterium]|nr:hypothetical protein [Betaproteobacteria bacterium]